MSLTLNIDGRNYTPEQLDEMKAKGETPYGCSMYVHDGVLEGSQNYLDGTVRKWVTDMTTDTTVEWREKQQFWAESYCQMCGVEYEMFDSGPVV